MYRIILWSRSGVRQGVVLDLQMCSTVASVGEWSRFLLIMNFTLERYVLQGKLFRHFWKRFLQISNYLRIRNEAQSFIHLMILIDFDKNHNSACWMRNCPETIQSDFGEHWSTERDQIEVIEFGYEVFWAYLESYEESFARGHFYILRTVRDSLGKNADLQTIIRPLSHHWEER